MGGAKTPFPRKVDLRALNNDKVRLLRKANRWSRDAAQCPARRADAQRTGRERNRSYLLYHKPKVFPVFGKVRINPRTQVPVSIPHGRKSQTTSMSYHLRRKLAPAHGGALLAEVPACSPLKIRRFPKWRPRSPSRANEIPRKPSKWRK